MNAKPLPRWSVLLGVALLAVLDVPIVAAEKARLALGDALRVDLQAQRLAYGLQQTGDLKRLDHTGRFYTVFVAPDASWPAPLWTCLSQSGHEHDWALVMGQQISQVHWVPHLTYQGAITVRSVADQPLALLYPDDGVARVNGVVIEAIHRWANGHTMRIAHPLLPDPAVLTTCQGPARAAQQQWNVRP